jgi:hypothetical protein
MEKPTSGKAGSTARRGHGTRPVRREYIRQAALFILDGYARNVPAKYLVEAGELVADHLEAVALDRYRRRRRPS